MLYHNHLNHRDRIEDLGRLAVMLNNILNHELFKEEVSWSKEVATRPVGLVLSQMIRGIDDVRKSLEEALEIAKGVDALNGSEIVR